jgi:hypothetical protein
MESKDHQNTHPTIQDLQARVEKLEKSKDSKDVWDVVNIIGSLLIPVAIAFTGYLFTQQQKLADQLQADRQLAIQKQFNQANTEIATIQAQVEQSQAFSGLIEALSSSDGPRRKLAVVAVEIALEPADAKKVLEIIAAQDSDPEVVAAAETSLQNINTAINAEDNERAGFQALLGGELAAARQYFAAAYDTFPTLHNVDEIYNRLLTTERVQAYENANSNQQQEILQGLYRQILEQYSWGMPEDLKQEMARRVAGKA